jgi:hypothetical protein
MLRPVEFDDQVVWEANEIDDVRADGGLPAEFDAQLLGAQEMPQSFFSGRCAVAKLAGKVTLFLIVVHESTNPPSPALPARGREPEILINQALHGVLKQSALPVRRSRRAELRGIKRRHAAVEAEFVGEEFERLRDPFGVFALAAHAAAEFVVVHFAAADGLNAAYDPLALLGPVAGEPIFEDRPHGPWEAEHLPAGADCAGYGNGSQDRGNFGVGQAGNDWGHHHAHRDAGGGEFADGAQPGFRGTGSRFQAADQIGVERGDGDVHRAQILRSVRREQIEIAHHQRILRDDAERLLGFGHHFDAAASDSQSPLRQLVAIGHARHGDDFPLPTRLAQFGAQQRRSIGLVKHLGFEIEPSIQAEGFVPGASIAVSTAMLAAAVRIDAVAKRNIRAVIVRDNAARLIGEKLGRLAVLVRRRLQFVIELLPIGLAPHALEPIGGRDLRTTADNVRYSWLGRRHRKGRWISREWTQMNANDI